jgi:dephospho-CoA kinase
MVRVALTGGIATGKSFCLSRLAGLGAAVVDADVLAREVVAPATPGLERIIERFGPQVVHPDGTLDRAALGRIIFTDRVARADLEAIIHPEVYRHIGEWFANLPTGIRVGIADIPLLFETGHQHDFDRVIVCACEPAEQLRRVMKRDGLSLDAAQARLEAQWPIGDKVARADYVIRTDGSFSETEEQLVRTYESLKAEV